MKGKNLLLNSTIVVGIISFFSIFALGMALADISQDYVSSSVLQNSVKTQPVDLPEWASCPAEWTVANIAYVFILLFHILLLALLIKNHRKNSGNNKE